MDRQPLISVIIPTYNRTDFLCELIESLWRQTYRHLQIIIVNDCGESVDFVKDLYPELDITVVNMESNQKHVHARNKGLGFVSGEYIMLCDDDDLLLPGHVERMLRELEDSDMVYSDVEIFDYELEAGVRRATKRFVFAYEYNLAAMRRFSTFFSSGCVYRRALHERLGLFDVKMHHYWDWDFFLRTAEQYRVKRVPVASALYAFAQSGSSNMSGDLEDMRPFLDKLAAKHGLGELPTKNFFLLLEEPEVKAREAQTELLWDGEPIVSRLAVRKKEA
ncbi:MULTISPECIES: glycosyltransferase [unclassified Paenibacillus]|uniref:glycosyltransferase family 2 protein n=1 Tax=unclassified Paenibacillus TaxID=185978 RepID=UPI001AE52C67|nr:MULTISPECIES: glycosyltransferase [unclassified Paenibacillus]MBP1157587.1 glycosyltransferase involved in cell wall biosynthesis [Paenibacillus sp. PvP091]MBP1171676.1 glycosyltransferase involved in cell wall biosynthesis [Paenibacillus sp. PvR098]MBP2438057.1 glycosyltransferase involved in cell wall biosynthesis [Paenibacillus sp. PvP052]